MEISAQGTCATASVKTRNTRRRPGPFNRARISTSVRCNTQATFFLSADATFIKSLSRTTKKPKNTTNQSKGFTTASFQDRCCSFQEQSKSFIIKKTRKKKNNKTQTKKQCASVKLRRWKQGSIQTSVQAQTQNPNCLMEKQFSLQISSPAEEGVCYLYKKNPAPPRTARGSSSRVAKPRWPQPREGQSHHRCSRGCLSSAAARRVLSLASGRTQKCWLSEYPPKVLEVLSLKRFFPQCQVYKCVSL